MGNGVRRKNKPTVTVPAKPAAAKRLKKSRQAPPNNRDLESEIESLKAKLARATDARKEAEAAKAEAEAEVERVAKADKKADPVVPKPRAIDMDNGTDRLRAAMGLIDDKPKYMAILSTVRKLVHRANLDLMLEYRRQPATDLGALFRMARRLQPYLSRFQHDWATAEIVKQYLSNCRKSESRKRNAAEAESGRARKRRHVDDMDLSGGSGDESDDSE